MPAQDRGYGEDRVDEAYGGQESKQELVLETFRCTEAGWCTQGAGVRLYAVCTEAGWHHGRVKGRAAPAAGTAS